MVDQSTGNSLVFNGEIYNYELLKKNLILEGIDFKTNSDTEVLLKVLSRYGSKYVSKFEGMFSFAFYEKVSNKLTLARDFLGKKPLYYYLDNNQFIFSSRIEIIRKRIDKTNLDDNSMIAYLKFGYVIDPKTMYKEISSLNQGSILTIDLDSLKIDSVIQFIPDSISYPSNTKTYDVIDNAIRERVSSHNKFAISLSGGLDSSIIALQSSKLGLDCHAYSMHWPYSDKERYNTDFKAASKISKELNLKFHAVEMPESKEISSILSTYVSAMDEPNSNPSGLSMMALYSKIANDGIRLVLTGDGADEVYGGYDRYSLVQRINRLPNIDSRLLSNFLDNNIFKSKFMTRSILSVLSSDSKEFWVHFQQLTNTKSLEKLLGQKISNSSTLINDNLLDSFHARKNKVAQLMIKDLLNWLTMESNKKLDRISMWYSIEARSPFQSESVVGQGLNEMAKFKFSKLNKKILIEAFPDLYNLPINKAKMGFISPVGHWLRHNKDLIGDSVNYLSSKFNYDKKELIRLAESPKKRNYEEIRFLWSLIVFCKWHDSQNTKLIIY
jgi:asparagine synthase (glutamine-hydrolysing)